MVTPTCSNNFPLPGQQGQGSRNHFCWLSRDQIPTALDLRECGWTLESPRNATSGCIGLLPVKKIDETVVETLASAIPEDARRFILLTGINDPVLRSTLIQHGFGEVVTTTICREELEARAGRIADFTRWLPRQRRLGPLLLDLIARDAYGNGIALNLNPREFALIWRLADTPNTRVGKEALIRDVWRLGFVPETNSIAVHMSRLRRKLSFAGLDGIIETVAEGGYRLAVPMPCSVHEMKEAHSHYATSPSHPLHPSAQCSQTEALQSTAD